MARNLNIVMYVYSSTFTNKVIKSPVFERLCCIYFQVTNSGVIVLVTLTNSWAISCTNRPAVFSEWMMYEYA